MLTGKCKEDFDKWYLKGVHKEEDYDQYVIRSFYSKSLSMKYGVYVDFFESVEIDIGVVKNHEGTFNNWAGHIVKGAMSTKKTRPEARKAAIEYANGIYNNRNE